MQRTLFVLMLAALALTGGSVGAQVIVPPDFVTGGGYIFGTPSGARGNFGVGGGVKDGAFWGHLNYIDHGSDLHVKATSITGYESVDARTRKICGTYVTNTGESGSFLVTVTDMGEPDGDDIFEITLVESDYSAAGDLGGPGPGGGNIRLHGSNPSNTPPTEGVCPDDGNGIPV
jgi:hypothetical protein